jgi:hypothetical protein
VADTVVTAMIVVRADKTNSGCQQLRAGRRSDLPACSFSDEATCPAKQFSRFRPAPMPSVCAAWIL